MKDAVKIKIENFGSSSRAVRSSLLSLRIQAGAKGGRGLIREVSRESLPTVMAELKRRAGTTLKVTVLEGPEPKSEDREVEPDNPAPVEEKQEPEAPEMTAPRWVHEPPAPPEIPEEADEPETDEAGDGEEKESDTGDDKPKKRGRKKRKKGDK